MQSKNEEIKYTREFCIENSNKSLRLKCIFLNDVNFCTKLDDNEQEVTKVVFYEGLEGKNSKICLQYQQV